MRRRELVDLFKMLVDVSGECNYEFQMTGNKIEIVCLETGEAFENIGQLLYEALEPMPEGTILS